MRENGTLLVPHVNWRGQFVTGTTSTGMTFTSGNIKWPAAQVRVFLDGGTAADWWGGLIQDQLDASGMLYRRNRYYDPKTGQFTQIDPIGIAGGLNVYGFAAGDPISFSDPLGLCPRITVKGKDVVIEAKAEFINATPADATAVRRGIQQHWAGRMHGYSVTVNLDVADAPTIEVFFQPARGNRGGLGGSFGRNAGGQMMVTTGRSSSTLRGVAAHEFGHVMGLSHLNESDNLMNQNYDADKTRISAAQLEQAIANCEVKPAESKADGKNPEDNK